ncbi:MAG: helix-turn-helix transcriptional regulator [Clostridiales bacterium]|nr:helix-turn-helix transcriptional regulator [Candidatus Blautia equi]
MKPMYLSIQQTETGRQIKKMLAEHGYTVRDVQTVMGFENPQAIYKWLSGKSLPSLDNLIILSRLLHSSIEDILVIDGDVSFWKSLFNLQLNDVFLSLCYTES